MRSTDTSTACDDLSRPSGILPSRHSSSANLLLGAVLWSERDNDRRLGIEQTEEFADRRKGEWPSLRGGCYKCFGRRSGKSAPKCLMSALWGLSYKTPVGGHGVLTFGKRRIV